MLLLALCLDNFLMICKLTCNCVVEVLGKDQRSHHYAQQQLVTGEFIVANSIASK